MIANAYDALNRLRTIDKPGAELDVTNSYDNFNNLITASQTGASVTWAYDALGRVTSEAQGLGTVSYIYDTAGRRTRLTYPGASFYVNYQYFDDNKLKLIGLNGATTGANVQATYYDDQLGRRASMCRGTGTTSSCASVARTTYGYDAISRMTGLTHDLVTGASANDASWTLAYSPASQLTSRAASSALYEWPYATTFTDAYAPANGLNQYTTVAGLSLAYDGRGNTTNDTTKTYTYDSSNMLTSSSNGAALTYDPTGRLLSAAQGGVTTKFLYDGTRLIAEYNGSNALLRRYIHGDGVDDPIVWYDSTGTTNKRNLFKDERGSVIAADTGSVVTTVKYDEYGTASSTGPNSPRFKYTGQAWLPELGLYYYKARIYNPDLGRFMQTDPIGTADQVNLYAYVGNDPLNGTDPTGKECTNGSNEMTRCVTKQYDVSFPTPEGFQNTNTKADDYHTYDTPARSPIGESATRDWVRENPTPAPVQGAATREGTVNDATPVVGGMLPVRISPVESFRTTNQVSGNEVVVNATLPGHPLGNGIVVRDTMPGPNGTSIIQNWGEGNGALQAPGSPLAGPLNGVWGGHTPPPPPSGYDVCRVRPGAC